MGAYVLRRLLIGVLVVWGVYTLTFFAVNLAPGNPFANVENPRMQKEDLDRLRAKWGYDRPVVERYFLHLRKMFWASPDVLEYESGGIAVEVFGTEDGDGNAVRARVQTPPAAIVLSPYDETRLAGGETVRVERKDDGSYGPVEVRPGRYRFGSGRLVVGDTPDELVTSGVTIRAEGGTVTARPTLATAPEEVVFERFGGGTLVLPRTGDGAYGPVPAASDRYTREGTDVLVPAERLEEGGPTFDLGTSIAYNAKVSSHLAGPLKNTLILALAALVLDFVIGVVIGVISAVRQHSVLDHALTVGSLFVYSMPGFWLGLMLVLVFAVRLEVLPAEGMHDVGETGFLDLLEHMVLPTFVLGIGAAASTARYQRSALIEVLGQDYVRTARAKGLEERTVIWKHAIRNALLPIITLLGLSLPFLVSGAVITEVIFSWPGMGREAVQAIASRDVFLLTGITLIATTMVVLGSLLADVLYAVVDPRVRLS
jgi:peptide/nickel transport system permease protein